MGSIIIKGASSPFRAPEITDLSEGGTRRLRVAYYGTYAALVAMQPAVGAELAAFEDMAVKSVLVTRDETGSYGTLEINLEAVDGTVTPIAPEDGSEISSTREILWQNSQRPILEHPTASAYSTELSAWMLETRPNLKKTFFYTTYGEESEGGVYIEIGVTKLSSSAQLWALKIMKGIESWMDFFPLARLTTTYASQPLGTGCGRGTMGAPLGITVPTGYGWMKTGDTITQNSSDKLWTRVQEWTGMKAGWDADIYGGTGI